MNDYVSSHPRQLSPDRTHLYVAGPLVGEGGALLDSFVVKEIELKSGDTRTLEMEDGAATFAVPSADGKQLFVVGYETAGDPFVAVVDLRGWTEVERHSVQVPPVWLSEDAATGRLFLGSGLNRIDVIDARTGNQVGQVQGATVGDLEFFREVVFDPLGRHGYVTRSSRQGQPESTLILDLNTLSVIGELPEVGVVDFSADGLKAYGIQANNDIAVLER